MARREQQAADGGINPFEIAVPQAKLDQILQRVRAYPWAAMPRLADDEWHFGPPVEYLRSLADYWATTYDWRAQERALNRSPQFLATVEGQQLHFIRERGSGRNPQPLLLLHGWPYSFASFAEVIEPLAHPDRFGGSADDGFDVIVPSLPGYGFSGKPDRPLGPARIATLLDSLMTDILGYDRYFAQGGDWGGFIASRLGFDHSEHVAGIHSNSFMVRHDGAALGSGAVGGDEATGEERAFVTQEQQGFLVEGGYSTIQATRPQTLGYAMTDSPVGVAAWMVEKFHGWSDRRERPFAALFSQDQLLTEIMIYLVTDTFVTASWIYAAYLEEGSATLPAGRRVEVPTAFAAFPDPVFAPPPRSFMERSHNVVQWGAPPQGGHFPFIEVTDHYLDDLRRFARSLRSSG